LINSPISMLFIHSGKESGLSDEEIIAEFRKSQNPSCIATLFDRYNQLVFAVSIKYLKNIDDSKDAVIRIFEKLPRDLLSYSIQNFAPWLHTVTKNDCLRFLSKKKNYFFDIENIADVVETDAESGLSEFLPLLEPSIKQLNNEQRICIELFYLQRLSYKEVCEQTGYDMKQVKSFIQNGKRNLKTIILKTVHEKNW
jgi:RNA polymerase sigma-70 factor (ECF subfamily)